MHGLVTHYVLFVIHLATRKVEIAGITTHPNEVWMKQVARNVTMVEWGFLEGMCFLLHGRDTKFCAAFRGLLRDAGVQPIALPPRSPT